MGFFSKEENSMPEIGSEIAWTQIISQVFKVIDFNRNGTKIDENGKVVAKSMFKPYGYLIVESPILNMPVSLPIVHRDDFKLATIVFDDPLWLEKINNKEWDLLVTYIPKTKLPGGLCGSNHGLHYTIASSGKFEEYYSFSNDKHMSVPNPEKLFDNISWGGEIKIGMNINEYPPGKETHSEEVEESESENEVVSNGKRTGNFWSYSKTMGREEAIDVYKMWLLHVRYYHQKLDVLFHGVTIPTFFLPVPMELLQETPSIIKEFTNEDRVVWTEESMNKNLEKYADRYYPKTGNDEEIIKGLGKAVNSKHSLELILQKIKENKDDWYFEYKEL